MRGEAFAATQARTENNCQDSSTRRNPKPPNATAPTLAIIGGTGLYGLAQLEDVETHQPVNPLRPAVGPVRIGQFAGARVAFLARHGEGHSLPPHRINYRANLAALQALGATRVLALNTVGGITERFAPRVLACPEQLNDYTWGRVSTYCEEEGTEVLHVDFGDPYTPSLRAQVIAAAARAVSRSRRRLLGATRVRGWRRRPRSRACAATVAIWSA